MFTNSFKFFSPTSLFVLVLIALTVSLSANAKTVRYVSDELNIPMRSGASNQHRILKFLVSGTPLTVIGTSEDGKYLNVETSKGKTGWVEARQVMNQPSARDRIVVMNEKLEKTRQTVKQLKQEISELKQKNRKLNNQLKNLQGEKQTLETSYDELQETASSTIALSRKNKQMQRELDQARANEKALEKENEHLKDNVMQDWFLIGGGVSIGSLIFGILLTRVNWRRRRNSWGDSF